MSKSSVSVPRRDPYKNFKFRLKLGGRYVAGISKVGPLKRTTDPGTGRTTFDAITLDSGVTHDFEFERWANQTRNFDAGNDVSLKDLKKDIIIEVYNEAGQLAIAYQVFRCWVSEFQVLPDVDAGANAVAIQHIRLENEGWVRDEMVTSLG